MHVLRCLQQGNRDMLRAAPVLMNQYFLADLCTNERCYMLQ
jgi:hypothetical protein